MRLILFCALVLLSGCTSCSNELLKETPVKWEVNLEQLEQQHFQEALTHLLPEGLIVYLKDPPGTVSELYVRAKNQADGAYFQGHLLAAVCFKYHVTKDPNMLEMAKKLWDAQHKLVTMSGYPGLIARTYGKDTPESSEYYVRKDSSGDAYSGWMFGANAFWHLIDDPERKAQIAEDLISVVKHLRKHDLHIYEDENTPTKYGTYRTPILGVPIGYYAMPIMAIATFAVKANPDNADCQNFLAWVVEKDYHRQCEYVYEWFPHSSQNVSNYYFNAFLVWLNDPVPHRREFYKKGVEGLWKRSHAWQMALHGIIYRYISGDHYTSFIQDSIDRLRNNPPYYARRIDQEDLIKSHIKIVPMEERPISSSIWMRDVTQQIDHNGPRQENAYARVDFLVTYWLGRYLGEYQPNAGR